jgi:hypothetical protein
MGRHRDYMRRKTGRDADCTFSILDDLEALFERDSKAIVLEEERKIRSDRTTPLWRSTDFLVGFGLASALTVAAWAVGL